MIRKLAGATLPLTALAACTAGPNYRVPVNAVANAPAANRPFVSSADKAYAQADLPPRWWRLYEDARLNAYVEEALGANTDLRAADANLRRAGEIVKQVEAGRTVQTRVDAAVFGARVGGYTLAVPLDLPWSGMVGASVDYPLDLAGGIKRGIEAANDQAEAAKAARDQVRVVVAATVARNYADVCSANLTLAATRHVLDLEKQTLSSVGRLFRGGRGTAFDVTRARSAADRSAAQIPEILAARQAALYQIAALMGRPPADYPRELESCNTPPMLRQPIPVGDGTSLIKRRPDIRAAERRLAAATAGIGIETAKLYPQVSLSGSAGLANSIASLFTGASLGGYAGPLISWAFPNRKAAHAQIVAAGDAAEAASAQFDGTVIEALRQTETALSSYAREIEHDHALESSRNDADKATAQANRLFRYGRTGFLDVLTTQSNLAEAEATLAQSRAELIDRQIAVFLALGGGWETTDDRAPSIKP